MMGLKLKGLKLKGLKLKGLKLKGVQKADIQAVMWAFSEHILSLIWAKLSLMRPVFQARITRCPNGIEIDVYITQWDRDKMPAILQTTF